MVLLTAENIRKSYGTRVIFDDISFSIHEGDKIGVIGVNGTGKSTLLKIIAGVDQADSGTIITMNGMRIGYLSQNPLFVEGTTVLQQVFRGENPQLALVRDYEETMGALAKTPEDEKLVKKAAELAEKMDKAEAWSLESEAKTILTKLGISDFEQKVETLSGGQKKRVALASVLLSTADLLISSSSAISSLACAAAASFAAFFAAFSTPTHPPRTIKSAKDTFLSPIKFDWEELKSHCIFSKVSGVQFTRSETSITFNLSFATITEEAFFFVSNTPI